LNKILLELLLRRTITSFPSKILIGNKKIKPNPGQILRKKIKSLLETLKRGMSKRCARRKEKKTMKIVEKRLRWVIRMRVKKGHKKC